jgi:hypothetical protein
MNPLIAGHFEQLARSCTEMGSPFTAAVCRALITVLDETSRTGQRVLTWPGDPDSDALALRICGGLHALVLGGQDGQLAQIYPPNDIASAALMSDTLRGAILRHDDWLCDFLSSPPQTNEIGRSSVLLPGFLMIARETGLPLALHEIGSSAGLNLFSDRFRYCYRDEVWGDSGFPVELAPNMRGTVPDLAGKLNIASRTGSDIAPLNVENEADRLRLRCYIWADQSERLARLDAAIQVARNGAVTLKKADAADFVEQGLASRKAGECLVLFHSVVWQYLPEHTRQAIEAAMRRAGAGATPDAPLAWLRMETLKNTDPHPVLQLTLWPAGETRQLALSDFHGRWIDWLTSKPAS